VLADLESDAARLSNLVHDLLALSREDAGGELDNEVRLDTLARETAATDARITVDARSSVAVRGDHAALERALLNLIDNAERYGPAGGRITVAVRQSDGWARLSVRDQGPGLNEADATHAFERFWRGAHDDAGSGLGLSIVRATAERHGGRVTVNGSEFTIELPALTDFSNSAGTPEGENDEKGRT
jgi:signal transduction histidine kinase